MPDPDHDLTRRTFVAITTGAAGLTAAESEAAAAETALPASTCSLVVNSTRHDLRLEPRATLLDVLREHLHLTGSKKGCDHGQCGACTVLVDGIRVLSCLTLAITQDGREITTIEGLASGEDLHPMQAAFIEREKRRHATRRPYRWL
jgi:xanthine dehydrogenase YagT iron-sulfur-binding subunit